MMSRLLLKKSSAMDDASMDALYNLKVDLLDAAEELGSIISRLNDGENMNKHLVNLSLHVKQMGQTMKMISDTARSLS